MLSFETKPYLHYLLYLLTIACFLGKSFQVVAGLIVIVFFYEKYKQKDYSFFKNPIFILLMTWCCYLLLSSLWAINPSRSLKGAFEILLWSCTYIAIVNILVKKEDIERFIKIQAYLILFICFNVFIQYTFGYNLFGTPTRGSGFTSDLLHTDKVYAYIFTLWIALFGGMIVSKQLQKKQYILFGISLFCLLVAIPLSGGRGPLIILSIFLPIIAWLSPYRKLAFSFLGILLICGVVLVSFNTSLQKRLSTLSDPFENQRQIRISIWLTAFEMFKDNPILGVGFKNFRENVFTYYDPSFDSIEIIPQENRKALHAHNPWMDILSEQGLIGIGFLLSLLFLITKSIYRKKGIVFVGSIGVWYSFSLLNSNFVLSNGSWAFFMLLSLSFFTVMKNYASLEEKPNFA
ncbi:MAG TPA: hypothetical protein CFH82_03835 [Sulfurospirillum sp. UBA12182]|nr:MAG TPA: hypothetical protein CFH82_03835 [Sulfurospirillum sp. UBA12182]